MSNAAEQLNSSSFEEFLAQQVDDPHSVKSEWVGGLVYVMAGGAERHAIASGLLYELLAAPSRRRGCRPFIFARLLKLEHAAYYPDVLVVCGPASNVNHETDARIIVEVSSRSTRAVDRREKATAYAQLPGLHAYVLVDPDQPVIEVATPNATRDLQRRRYGPGDVIFLDDATLVVDDFYDLLDATATT